MPLNNNNNSVPATTKKECCGVGDHGSFANKIILVLLGVLLVYSIIFMGSLIRNNMKKFFYIGKADRTERTIVVNGYGKTTGNNDIAMTTIGYSNTDKDVSKAQADNKKVMDQIYNELKGLGVEERDMQGNYTIFPDYNYTQDRGQEFKGYRVTNQLTVKIRDLSKISQILSLAGKYGATEVSGLSFTIDEPENLKADARAKALEDAKQKALYLAQQLGVKLGGVVSYNEYEGSNYMPLKAYPQDGMGGGPEATPGGTNDAIMNVNLTFEIL